MKYSDMKPSQLGYRVQDGRLVNDAPDLVSGISKAAMMRKEMKSRTLTQDIALGIELAEDRKNIKEFIDNIDVVYPDAKTIKYSLDIRRKGGLKLSDSIIAALAQQHNLILTTYDPDLLKQARSYSALKP